MSRAIVIWAKAPIPGLVKTRLCPPLTYEQAAGLQQAMTLDKVRQALTVTDTMVYVACYPPEEMESLLLPEQVIRIAQKGDSLEERLRNCLATMQGLGYERLIFSDSDSPALPAYRFTDAFDALNKGEDVCICPSEDGGYCFIALGGPHAGVFSDIPWSTNLVAECTVARASQLGLQVDLLPEGFDVDDAASLARLALVMGRLNVQAAASETYRWIRAHL